MADLIRLERGADLPYRYAPHDVPVVARQDGEVAGHVGNTNDFAQTGVELVDPWTAS